MALIIELPLSDRFTFLIKGLLTDVVGAIPSGLIPVPLIKLLWWRLRRMSARFAAIMAQYEAGTLPPPRPARLPPAPAAPSVAPSAPAEPRPTPSPRPLELPRHVGWVTQKIPDAEIWRPQLREMLADHKLPAALAAAPQLGSLLRSMCHMMAVKKPAWLRLPRGPRAPRPPKPKRILVRLGAGQLWRGPSGIWQREEDAKKFDAKIWVYPHELLEKWP